MNAAPRPVLVALSLALLAPAMRAQPKHDPFVEVREGQLPVIVSAPHGGRKPIPGVTERQGDSATKFVTARDDNTLELALKLAAALEKRLGKPVYLVAARFERKQADANRPAKDAYESPLAKPHYEAYHAALAKAQQAVQAGWNRGLLIDVHGQAADAGAIFRGTNNGKTVKHLTERFGRDGLTGPNSVLGQLAKRDYRILPANGSSDDEDKRYSGGHIVQTYGSREGGTVDALQLEFGGDFRTTKRLDTTANDVADAIAAFAKVYLPSERASGQ